MRLRESGFCSLFSFELCTRCIIRKVDPLIHSPVETLAHTVDELFQPRHQFLPAFVPLESYDVPHRGIRRLHKYLEVTTHKFKKIRICQTLAMFDTKKSLAPISGTAEATSTAPYASKIVQRLLVGRL